MQKPLDLRFNVAVQQICARVLPCGFDLAPHGTTADESLAILAPHFAETGRVIIWRGGASNTIFADAEINFAFRAWHDTKHLLHGLGFDRRGEVAAAALQIDDINALFDGATAARFAAIVRAEIIGQFDYAQRRGGFPYDQREFVSAYLADAETALNSDYGVSAE